MQKRTVIIDGETIKLHGSERTWRDVIGPAEAKSVDLGRYEFCDKFKRVLPIDSPLPLEPIEVIYRKHLFHETWLDRFRPFPPQNNLRSIMFISPKDSALFNAYQSAIDEFRSVGIIAAGFYTVGSFMDFMRKYPIASREDICGCVFDITLLKDFNYHRKKFASSFPRLISGWSLSDRRKDPRIQEKFIRHLPAFIPTQLSPRLLCMRIYSSLLLDCRYYSFLTTPTACNAERQIIAENCIKLRKAVSSEDMAAMFCGQDESITNFLSTYTKEEWWDLRQGKLASMTCYFPNIHKIVDSLMPVFMKDNSLKRALKKFLDFGEFIYVKA